MNVYYTSLVVLSLVENEISKKNKMIGFVYLTITYNAVKDPECLEKRKTTTKL